MVIQKQDDLNQFGKLISRPKMLSYILGQLSNRIYILDHEGTIVYSVLTQHSDLELVRNHELQSLYACIHPQHHIIVKERMDQLMNGQAKIAFECRWAAADGGWTWIEAVIMHVPEEDLPGCKYFLSVRNISDMKEREEQLSRMAYLDPLTDLPNRRAFELHLQQAVAHAKRYKLLMALLYADIDDFKLINDGYGHETGDLLLKAFAAKVKGCIREIDSVSRLGGDEFVVLLPRIDSVTSVRRVSERIMASIRGGWEVGGHAFDATISMGVAVFPIDGEDSVQLLQNVDKALYRVKNSGRNGIFYYHEL